MTAFAPFAQISRWFALRGFWRERADFYNDLAQALLDKELLRDFVLGELQITLAPATAWPERAKGLRYMQAAIEEGLVQVGAVLMATMPKVDHMTLATLREAKTEAEQAKALQRLAANVQERAAMTSLIRGAATSPLFLLGAGFVLALIFAKQMIPAFESAAPPEVWVGFAAVVRTAATGLSGYGVPAFACFVLALMFFVSVVLPNATGAWRYRAERARGLEKFLWVCAFPLLPVQTILGLYRDIQGAQMLTNLAGFLVSGRGLQDAVQELSRSTTPWMRRHLFWILQHLQTFQGDYVGAFSHGILSKELLAQLHTRVRRDSGADFSKTLIDLSIKGQETAKQAVKRITARLGFACLALVLGVNLFFTFGQLHLTQVLQEANSPAALERARLQKR